MACTHCHISAANLALCFLPAIDTHTLRPNILNYTFKKQARFCLVFKYRGNFKVYNIEEKYMEVLPIEANQKSADILFTLENKNYDWPH